MTQSVTDPVPAGYMQDSKGRLVPESAVKPVDKLRHQTVCAIAQSAKDLSAILLAWKRSAFADIDAFIEASAEQYDVVLRGAQGKGNVTLPSYDGRYKVVRQVQDRIQFDERLMAAKALVDECITDWSTGSGDEIKTLVNDAFQVDKEGRVSPDRVLGLRRHAFKDPKWLRAMDAIADSLQVVGSSSYVRVYERVGDSDQYRAIPLDLSKL